MPADTRRGRFDARGVTAVAAGGAVGGPARYVVDLVLPAGGWLPWSTLVVNVLGAGVLGWVVARLARPAATEPSGSRSVRPFVAVGVLGSFTTFSTLALQLQRMLATGRPGEAAGYLALTVAAGLVSAWVGLVAGRRSPRPVHRPAS